MKATFDDQCIREIFEPLLVNLRRIQKEKGKRIVVMLAAPPGTGKTTLAYFLKELAPYPITVIGMDGFHHYQDYLIEKNQVSIKGAPITFDLEKLTERLKMVSEGKECGWPEYNRALHDPQEDATIVKGDIVLIEGNYLLLEQEGWKELSAYGDYTIFIKADETFLRNRLVMRKAQGIPMHEAVQFVEKSDLANVREVLQHSKKADLMLEMISDGKYRVE